MTHPLREAVARAMFEAAEARLSPSFRHQWDNILSQRQDEYRYRARAAIAATLAGIREPGREVLQEMQGLAVCAGYLEEGWAAAIDALAKEVAKDG